MPHTRFAGDAAMRAEHQDLIDDIKQSLGLLRRSL
jgi:hypothetical protein